MILLTLSSCEQREQDSENSTIAKPAIPLQGEFSWVEGITDTNYGDAREEISEARSNLLDEIEVVAGDQSRNDLVEAIRTKFCSGIYNGLIPHWMGTPWDYNGTTQVPGEGGIACGYFVTTVLRDAGMNIDRVHLARQASEVMIKALVDAEYIKRYRRVAIDKFVKEVKEWGTGLYVVGLDNHTGFITYNGEVVEFIHSGRRGVVSEIADKSMELTRSRYRVLGKLSASEKLLQNWVLGKKPR